MREILINDMPQPQDVNLWVVSTTWNDEVKLYYDGKLLDTTKVDLKVKLSS